ncbi:recombinase RecT [Parerythrobacter lacustris]|uniref:Recombinase RecT n=1 Tax=Parerythrobacter lacustris TaxID=2969984 RepID=A0ABT1XSP9_9SPHN|nr:recombinase RecT [Parerythrobacter lacustris]MCR2833462.1 recombinase RecT [Parerythrobacter lacustris]
MTETKNQEGSTVAVVKAEITRQLAHPETVKALLDTTFKGLDEATMKRALLEGMLRGFQFPDFLKKDVYAIPYGGTYSLVTSIDYSRKIGMRSGVIGVSEPTYEMAADGTSPLSCSVTVKRRVGQDIGEFSAKVFFKEYTTSANLWKSKPLTMIAKVAEMHAYRKACPEELAQSFVEEEFQKPEAPVHTTAHDIDDLRLQLQSCLTMEALEKLWADIPGDAKNALKDDMERVKSIITSEAEATIQ